MHLFYSYQSGQQRRASAERAKQNCTLSAFDLFRIVSNNYACLELGIVFAKLGGWSENVGYLVPSEIIKHVLKYVLVHVKLFTHIYSHEHHSSHLRHHNLYYQAEPMFKCLR